MVCDLGFGVQGVYGLRVMVYGLWFYGLWVVVYGFLVDGLWLMVDG